jgi:hypothetical protein
MGQNIPRYRCKAALAELSIGLAFLPGVPGQRGLSGAFLGRGRSFDCRPWPAGFLAHCPAYPALGDERTAQRATDLCAHKGSNEYVLNGLSTQEGQIDLAIFYGTLMARAKIFGQILNY